MVTGQVSTRLRWLALAALLVSAAASVQAQTSQTIAFHAIPNQILGISPFPIAAPASSSLPVTFASTTPAVCKTASGLVMLLKAGTCSITASQGGNISYGAATPVTRSFTVSVAKPGSLIASAGSPFAVGSQPYSAAVGDFNGDGIPDIATANSGNNNVTVLLGNGSGGFTAAPGSPFAVGKLPRAVVVGDFNGDGIPDLAIANNQDNTVTVLLGNGSGGFTADPGSPFAAGIDPFSLVVGDFNGDGIPDLAVTDQGGFFTQGFVTILLGNGSGGFTTAPGSPYTVGRDPDAIAVGDFNGDGIQDLAVGNYVDSNVTVLLGNGLGGFTPAPGNPVSVLNPTSVVVGDFNGDGIQDLALGAYTWTYVTVLLGNGAGGFTAAPGSPYTVGLFPESVAVGDFNGDGIPDIVAAQTSNNNVIMLLGNGSGGFTLAPTSPFAVGGNPISIVVADFNGDGIEDLATANSNSNDNSVTVLLGFAAGHTAQTIAFGTPANVTYGVAPYTINATASSGLPVSLASTTPSYCTVAGSTVTIVAVGTCTIVASQPGNATYAAAATVTQSFTINQIPQTITFAPLGNVNLGVAPFSVSATASSGLAVSFTSATLSICRVSGNTVTVIAPGTCSISANQAGNADYAAAAPVTRSFTVAGNPVSQTIAFDAVPNRILGISPFPIAAVASSTLPIGIASTTPAVCKTAADLVMLLGAGTCSITASQAGNASYTAASSATRNFTVSVAKASNSFTAATGSPFTVGAGPTSVAIGDFNGDGIPDLATANSSSSSLTVLLGNGSGGFTPAAGSPFAVGANPFLVVVGDFNGDGIPDVATANQNSNNVTVLLGNRSGGFTEATGSPFAVGARPESVAVGDFNGDGIQDLAVASYSGGNVTVLLGDGAGGFTPAPGSPITLGFFGAWSVAVGDFNGDGIQDLAVANYSDGYVAVLLGNGSGGFTPAAGSPFIVGSGPYSVVVGDFNGDGIQDLATANWAAGNVTVLLGNGSGKFSAAPGSPFAVGAYPESLVVGDFNGDGVQDLAVANSSNNNVTVLLGNGSGSFTAETGSPFTVGSSPQSLVVGDFNRDGIQDLAVANTNGGNVTVLLGTAAGQTPQTITFGPLGNVTYGVAPFTIGATASSGLPVSFASTASAVCTVVGSTVTIVGAGVCSIVASQTGNATYAPAATVTQTFAVTMAQTIAFGALNNQALGSSPPALSASASSGLTVGFASNSAGVCTVSGTAVTLAALGTCSVTASQPGNSIYAAATPVTRTFTVSTGTSQTITIDAVPNQIFGISPFPIAAKASSGLPVSFASTTPSVCKNADDLVMLLGAGACSITASQGGNASYNAATPVTRSFTVSRAKPSGSFTAATGSPFAVGTHPYSLLVGDFNGDGIQDLAVANQGSNTVTVLLGNGSGGFTAATGSPSGGGSPRSAAIGDFNGDGIQDLAITNQGSNSITVLLGNGSGGFTAAAGSPFPVGTFPISVAVGDFNGDGIQDLVTANFNSNNITVLLGNGSGGFTAATGSPFAVGSHPYSVAAGDFNGDGIEDVGVANESDGTVTVLLGNGSGGFTAAPGSPFTVGLLPSSLAVGDFNGDGIQDLATANQGSGNVTVLLGNGSGGFTAANGSPLAVGATPFSVVVGDFNGDGIQDLAVANVNSNNVTVLLGFATGATSQTIAFGPLSAVTYGASPFTIGATSNSGLAVSFASTTSSVCTVTGSTVTIAGGGTCSIVASQAGNATYAPAATVTQSFTVKPAAQTIAFAGLRNVSLGVSPFSASATASSGLAITFTSTTTGVCTVAGSTVTIIAAGTCSITASQAGNANYAAATSVSRSFTVVAAGSQTIAFDAIPNRIFGTSPFPIAAQASSGLPVSFASTTPAVCKNADDLVMLLSAGTCSITASQGGNGSYGAATPATRHFIVSLANPSGTLTAATGSPFPAGAAASSVAVGDFNGDGIQDLAIGNSDAANVTVLLGNGAGGFVAAIGSPFAVGAAPGSIAVGDFNGDGIPDLATANENSGNVTVLLGNGSGGFTPATGSPFAVGAGPVSVAVGDFNGDGIQDLAVANYGSGNVTVLLGNGSGGFTPAAGSPFAVGTSPASIAVADLNGDGIQDLAVANSGSNNVTVLLGNGSGGFTPATDSPFTAGTSPSSIAVGDFNGDGFQDVAVANYGSNNVTILLGTGSGGFTPAAGSPFVVGTEPVSVTVGDLNGDGMPDLAVANFGGKNVTVLVGNGSGGFTAAAGNPFAVGTSPFSVAVGDFNGDGIQDLAAANSGDGNVTVLLGGKASTSSALTTTSPSTISLSGAVPLTLTVSDTTTAFSTPTGTATFLDGSTVLGTASQTGSPYTFSASNLGLGSHTLTATYGGDARSLGSTSSSIITIQVNAAAISQTITFGPLANQTLGSPAPALSATATSGLTVSFTTTTSAVCTVSGTTVTLVSAGACSITASQPGNSTYAAATPVVQTFTVSDTVLTLAFTGTATCETGFAYQECSSGGPVTGTYSLDVNTQTIVGAWSFTTPYGVISSTMTGASAGVAQQALANGLNREAYFQVSTTSPAFHEVLALYFAAPNNKQLGTVYSPGGGLAGSSICQNIPNQSSPGCEPDVALAGTTTALGAALPSFAGGPTSTPATLPTAAPVVQVTGTIAGGSQNYYTFQWAGGAFSATASITGADAGTSYLFSEGAVPGCGSGSGPTLNSGNSFTGTIAIASLAPGQYCIGVAATGSSDPAFTLTFNTPVNGAPSCDIDGAPLGAVDIAGVQSLVNQALGANSAANDLNGDGAVNVVDVQIEVNAALGSGCALGVAHSKIGGMIRRR